LLIDRDLGHEKFCQKAVKQTVSGFGKIDILVNAAAERHPQDSILFGRIFSSYFSS
jgi:NAD(P)-dependent dehydrogenase (short-subunit alcohol dehydrogenase family)